MFFIFFISTGNKNIKEEKGDSIQRPLSPSWPPVLDIAAHTDCCAFITGRMLFGMVSKLHHWVGKYNVLKDQI